jgi:hypothetical protein
LFLVDFCLNGLVQYGVKIFVLTSFRDTCYIEILPVVEKSKRGSVYFIYLLLMLLSILDQQMFYSNGIVKFR